MSDEVDAAPTEDTPNVETPETTDVNWQKRYEDLRPEFDRTKQAMSRFESDPTAVEEFIRQHHPDMLVEDEPEEDDVYTDDDQREFMTKQDFQSWQKEQATQEAQRTSAQQYETDIKRFAGERELTKFGRNAIDALALRGEITTPEQLETAVNEWFAYEDSRAPQKTRRTPHVVPGGKANTGTKDVSEMSRAELNQHMAERLHAHESQT